MKHGLTNAYARDMARRAHHALRAQLEASVAEVQAADYDPAEDEEMIIADRHAREARYARFDQRLLDPDFDDLN